MACQPQCPSNITKHTPTRRHIHKPMLSNPITECHLIKQEWQHKECTHKQECKCSMDSMSNISPIDICHQTQTKEHCRDHSQRVVPATNNGPREFPQLGGAVGESRSGGYTVRTKRSKHNQNSLSKCQWDKLRKRRNLGGNL